MDRNTLWGQKAVVLVWFQGQQAPIGLVLKACCRLALHLAWEVLVWFLDQVVPGL
jgi:hypothetical protein